MSNPYPWFRFYAGDFLGSQAVKMMSLHERGLYITLLAEQWMNGSLPSDLSPAGLCKLTGDSGVDIDISLECARTDRDPRGAWALACERMEKAWEVVQLQFPPHPDEPDRLANPRLLELQKERLAEHRELAERGKKGAAERKRRGGYGRAMAGPKPGFASAVASQSQSQSQKEEEETRGRATPPPRKTLDFRAELVARGLDPELGDLLQSWWRGKKGSKTQKALRLALGKLAEMPEEWRRERLEHSLMGKHPSVYPPSSWELERKKAEPAPVQERRSIRDRLSPEAKARLRKKGVDL